MGTSAAQIVEGLGNIGVPARKVQVPDPADGAVTRLARSYAAHVWRRRGVEIRGQWRMPGD